MKIKKIFTIPYEKSDYFCGRDSSLQKMSAIFEKSNKCVLCGLGGIGKTQLAVEYSLNLKHSKDIIYFINSENSQTIKNDLYSLGERLGLHKKTTKVTQKIGNIQASNNAQINITQNFTDDRSSHFLQIIDWLNSNDNWLLIFDNADSYQDIKDFIPLNDNGMVIITSRSNFWGKIPKIPIDGLDEHSAVTILEHITEIKLDVYAYRIAKALDYLPLALEQCAAYIYEQKIRFQKYYELYKKTKIKLLKEHFGFTNNEATIATTWNITIEKVKNENKKSIELIEHSCFYQPLIGSDKENIKFKYFLLDAPVGNDPSSKNFKTFGIKDELELRSLLAILQKYSLIKIYDNYFIVHNLLQEIMIHYMNPNDLQDNLVRVQIITELNFKFNWFPGDIQFTHSDGYSIALSVINNSIEYKVFSLSLTVLIRRAFNYSLYVLRDTVQANSLLEILKNIIEKNPPISLVTWTEFYFLSSCYFFEKKCRENALSFINKAEEAVFTFYLSTNLKSKNREIYSNYMKGVCKTLHYYSEYKLIVLLSKKIIKINVLAKDTEIVKKNIEYFNFYFNNVIDYLNTKNISSNKNEILNLISKTLYNNLKSLSVMTNEDLSSILIKPLIVLVNTTPNCLNEYLVFKKELNTIKVKAIK